MRGNVFIFAGSCLSLVIATLVFFFPAPVWAGTFVDDFNDGNADGWTVLDFPFSDWSIEDGGYHGEIFEGAEGLALIGEPDWQVDSVEATIRDITGEWLALVWNFQDVNNFDAWWINVNGSTVEAWPKIGAYEGAARVAEPIPLDVGGEQTMKVVISQGVYEVYFNDELMGEYLNDTFTTGQVGLLVWNATATYDDVTITGPSIAGGRELRAGDADQDLDFDQLDLVRVQVAAKYLTGRAATWGEGDWDGAPGGQPGSPPAGNARFDQLDIIAALAPNHYLKGPYAAVRDGGVRGDGQTSIVYNPTTGELAVDAPAGVSLTSVNIDSAGAVFTGAPAQNLGGSFDNDANGNIFKATFGSSFGSISFGNVAQTGLSKNFVLGDLTVVGSLAGGGALGNVDLIYVPEPSTIGLLAFGLLVGLWRFRRTHP
jgi:hypothetical protein